MPLRAQLRTEVYEKFIYYRELHFPDEKLEAALLKAGINESELAALKEFLAAERKKTKHQYGVALIILGSVILVAGFIWTAMLYHQNASVEAVMYGFTSAGLTLLIAGICFLF